MGRLKYKADIDWVDEIPLTKNKLAGEITDVFSDISNKNFNDGMANKLPVGAKIYSAKERGDILIVEIR
ncbi:hypothetical protein ACFVR1_11645 [Psychrobacillus sp. NPDC058041]|uniref:hypothetical protein n=1 Tax=Psychrobacillus sp. NPDC058041 TaxID=3346310 RepID=UPI0036DC2FC5